MFFSKMVHIFMQDSYVVMTYVSPPLVPAKRQRSKEFGDTDAKRGIPFAYAKKPYWSFATLRPSGFSSLSDR
jgi:hypothetical protein